MALLNFLYKDAEFAESLYAQIFNGLVSSIEQSEKSEDAQSFNGKLTCGIAGGSAESKTATGNSRIEKISPHDILFVDVLKYLESSYKTDVGDIDTGDVVLCKGALYIIDNELIKLSFETIGSKIIESNPDVKSNKGLGKMISSCLKKMFEYPKDDLKYVLILDDGREVTGIVKSQCMSDSVVSFMMKFGPFPVTPVYVVGVVEDGPAKPASVASNPFPNGNTNQIAVEVAKMFFQASGRNVGAISVKPLAIFQKINVAESTS